MTTTALTLPLNGFEIKVLFTPSARAKRMNLKIDPYANIAKVTVPKGVKLDDAHSFLRRHHGWLEEKFGLRGQKIAFTVGSSIPILGKTLNISYSNSEKPLVTSNGDQLLVQGFDEIVVPGLVKDWLRRTVYEKLASHSQSYAQVLGKRIQGISLKEMKSRWGSCSSTGNLSYNWRLVFAPYESLQYVCAHEVAHMIEMNHSEHFWTIVEKLFPAYKSHRRWLKQNGHQLFMYG